LDMTATSLATNGSSGLMARSLTSPLRPISNSTVRFPSFALLASFACHRVDSRFTMSILLLTHRHT
jgi:hypothetical protein